MLHSKLPSRAGTDARKDAFTVKRSDGVEEQRERALISQKLLTGWIKLQLLECAELSLWKLYKLDAVALEVKNDNHTPGFK